jgi:hypothetical protein
VRRFVSTFSTVPVLKRQFAVRMEDGTRKTEIGLKALRKQLDSCPKPSISAGGIMIKKKIDNRKFY